MGKGTVKVPPVSGCSDLEECASLFIEPVFLDLYNEPDHCCLMGIDSVVMRSTDAGQGSLSLYLALLLAWDV